MNRYFHVYQGKAIFSLMCDAGYDILALGNHEFDKGTDVLSEALEKTKFTTLCSDLDVSHSTLNGKCQYYKIKELDGVKVCFFSLIVESLLNTSSAKNVTLKDTNIAMAKRMVKELKAINVDLIVLISHLGYKVDVALAKQVKGVDVILVGVDSYIKKIGRIGKTVIVNGGEQGSQVVKVDIPVSEDLKVLHKQITMTKIPVTAEYVADVDVAANKLQVFTKKLPKSIVLGKTNKDWGHGL